MIYNILCYHYRGVLPHEGLFIRCKIASRYFLSSRKQGGGSHQWQLIEGDGRERNSQREKDESNDMLSADKVSGEEMLSGSQEVTQQFVPITSN